MDKRTAIRLIDFMINVMTALILASLAVMLLVLMGVLKMQTIEVEMEQEVSNGYSQGSR